MQSATLERLQLRQLRHLRRMTDGTGLLEHAYGGVPRRREGYTTDDNARALWMCVEWRLMADGDNAFAEELDRLANIYMAFLLWAQREDGRFHNNFAYDRTPEAETPSDDCHGRVMWACAAAWTDGVERLRLAASDLFAAGLAPAMELKHPRGWAHIAAACARVLERFPEGRDSAGRNIEDVRRKAEAVLKRMETALLDAYRSHAGPGWRWFEPIMTYGNGTLPWGLLAAFRISGNKAARDAALEALDFLIEKMTGPGGCVQPIGNDGWCTRERCAEWDQQPLEVMKLALGAAEAYRVTGRSAYRETVKRCRAWFHGDNRLGIPLADASDGSCFDGLQPTGPNLNRGAESTLSYLLTEAICHHIN